MNLQIKLENILFLDIETVPQKENWQDVSETTRELFEQKTLYQRKEELTAEDFYERAGIWVQQRSSLSDLDRLVSNVVPCNLDVV